MNRLRSFLVLAALSCGSRTDLSGLAVDAHVVPFPVGTYTNCAIGTVVDGPFLTPAGFDPTVTLTVTDDGGKRKATLGTRVWELSPTTSVTAELAPAPQTNAGFAKGICVHGIGVSNETFFPTELTASAGTMTYQSGAMFISLAGDLASQMDCGNVSAPAAAWVVCDDGPAPVIDVASSSAAFPVGDYSCASQFGTHVVIDGIDNFITSGGHGALTLAQAGSTLTASYSGDADLAGTLQLESTAPSIARATAGQTLGGLCTLSASGDLLVTAASLAVLGQSVVLSVDMGGSGVCSGAKKAGALVCTKS